MNLRITTQTLVNQAVAESQLQTSTLARLQQQAATGARILTPADDPAAAEMLVNNNAQDQRLTSDLTTIKTAVGTLNLGVSTLNAASDVLTQAKALALEGSQSTNNQVGRNALADQVDSLLNRMLALANTQQNGDYLFGGAAAKTQPFTIGATNSSGLPQQVTYQGATSAPETIVSQNQTVHLYLSGQDVFQTQQRQPTLYQGTTGASAGAGTDSDTGQGSLLVSHTATTYAPGSGVQPGTGSAAGDTILGPAGAHTLSIDDASGTGSSGTVRLDGGAAVSFTSSDKNLLVTAPDGSVAYVDTSALTPGYTGSVSITASGALSVDGGKTTTPIDFSSDQQVLDGASGAVTNVNSSGILRTGMETLDYQGTSDAFQVLMTLRDNLRNTAGLSETQQLQNISDHLGDLDRANTNILQAVGGQSAALQDLTALQNHLSDLQLTNKQVISNLHDADLTQVVVQLQSQQNAYQLTLASISRLFSTSLLQFLQ